MKVNFFGADPSYHEARRRFVFKGSPPPKAAPISVHFARAIRAGTVAPGRAEMGQSELLSGSWMKSHSPASIDIDRFPL